MLDAGVIEPSSSNWASAPVLIKKKDNTVRWTVDFRILNQKTVKDDFPLPIIEDCLDTLQEILISVPLTCPPVIIISIWLTKIEKKIAFITRYGFFEHTRMGMRLCNAPATFQRVM
jgi:hypothetical protein